MAFTTTSSAAGVSLIGTSGADTASFAPSAIVDFTYVGGQADGDTIVATAAFADGTTYEVNGGKGNDSIISDDITAATLRGNDGNDTITFVDAEDSFINGNAGIDTVTATGNLDVVTVQGGQGNDTFTANVIGQTLEGVFANGNKGDDQLFVGNTNASVITGGKVTLRGGAGNDTITTTKSAAAGASDKGFFLYGDDGTDTLTGAELLADTMTGGSGVDTFGIASAEATDIGATVVENADVITDFTAGIGGDKITINGTTADIVANSITDGSKTVADRQVVGRFVDGTFTSGAGSDLLIVGKLDADQVVLIGVAVDTLVAANFT